MDGKRLGRFYAYKCGSEVMSRFGRSRKEPPDGFEYIEPVLTALEGEMRDKVAESHEGKKKQESQQPVHQLTWQRSRYVYDMYYCYGSIEKPVYDYCIEHKLVDAGLIAKWKKQGYERLCSNFAINPKNFRFGTTSLCRVPEKSLANGVIVKDPVTGCQGCASGSSVRNIFDNKYGQHLAAVQLTREEADIAMAQEAEEAGSEAPEPKYYESVWANEDEYRQVDLTDIIGDIAGAPTTISTNNPPITDDNAGDDETQSEDENEQQTKRRRRDRDST